MAQKNVINNELDQITLDPVTGDSFIQYDISGVNKWRIGVDDTDSDVFVFSKGTALGTNNVFRMTSAGQRTLPLQPAFANRINAEANVTGDNTNHKIGSVTATTSLFDIGSNMTEGNGAGTPATFTAPVDGIFFFSFIVQYNINATGGDIAYFAYLKNGSFDTNTPLHTNLPSKNTVAGFGGANGYIAAGGSVLVSLTASDTITFRFTSIGGAKVDDVIDGWLSGYLVE